MRIPKTDDHLPLTPLSLQILVAMADEPRHGYGIIREIERSSGGPLRSSTGTLYQAIQRLEQAGLIREERRAPKGTDARRRYYGMTALGRRVAVAEADRLLNLLRAARDKHLIDRGRARGILGSPVAETSGP